MIPARAQTFGMIIFLVTLSILFASTMLLYVLLRLMAQEAYPPGALRGILTNAKLYTSTLIVLAASLTVHMALLRIRRERWQSFFRWLVATDLLALAFLAVQTPAMVQLLTSPLPEPLVTVQSVERVTGDTIEVPRPATNLHRLLFVLVLLHALHVIGGVAYLWVVTRRALRGLYDHEHYVGVRHAAMYWHFLDLVWLCMFGTFLVLG